MALVVSDTSPVRALASVGQLGLLPLLFDRIVVPPAVAAELTNPPAGAVAVAVDQLSFADIVTPKDPQRVRSLVLELDLGEAEAIALAVEINASLLIDEAAGRAVAQRIGLHVTGTVGILISAKSDGLVTEIRPLLDQLRRNTKFFLNDAFYDEVLRRAGE